MLTRSQLQDLFARCGFRPLRRLGENYLIDANIKDKIIAEVRAEPGDRVLEIGPGFGALTIDLAESGAAVVAVEKDPKAFSILAGLVGSDFPGLELVNGDILACDFRALAGPEKLIVVGNLPYYITSPIIERLIERRASIARAVILVQKEVAERLMAGPGTKAYGSFSVFVQYAAKVSRAHTVKRTAFYPEPEVDSAIVRLDMLDTPPVAVKDEALFFKIVRGSFNQRRKSIINSLSREAVLDLPKSELAKILAAARIDPTARPETLSLAAFARLTNAL